jgi:hypothetical protein
MGVAFVIIKHHVDGSFGKGLVNPFGIILPKTREK